MISSFAFPKICAAALSLGLLAASPLNAETRAPLRNVPLEGAHEFPLIFFAVFNNDDAFEQVKRLGGTHVHNYQMGKSVEESQEFFDRATRFDLKVMANLDGKRRIAEGDSIESLKEYVNHFKSHSALGFWYLYDEPANRAEPTELLQYYRALKAESPGVPVANGHEWADGWWRYNRVQDVLMNDIYPVTGAPFPHAKLQNQTKFTRASLRSGNHVIPILQIMNWRSMAECGKDQLRGYKVSELRYPNLQEMRYMAFSSIALGSKGLAFYSYDRSRRQGSSWMEDTLAPLLKEVTGFTKAIGYPNEDWVELDDAHEDVVVGLWKTEGTLWLLLANARSEAVTVSYPLHSALPNGMLEPWGNTRATEMTQAMLKDGVLTVEAEPWEVLIWKVREL